MYNDKEVIKINPNNSYKTPLLPLSINLDKETIELYTQAIESYTEYKVRLNLSKINKLYFINSLQRSESLTSSTIEGTQVYVDDLYYLNSIEQTDDVKEIINLKEAINYGEKYIHDKEININLITKLHEILLKSGRGSKKNPGIIRDKQNYIGSIGGMVTFTPPSSDDISDLLSNLVQYMNNKFHDLPFINAAISHYQFETIHPFLDGNGRLGRILIPLNLSIQTNDDVILFLSEVIELYKPTYYNTLNLGRKGNIIPFIKFFMQCISEQSQSNIFKLTKVETIYENDKKFIIENYNGENILKVLDYALGNIVFSEQDIQESTLIPLSTIKKIIKRLLDSNILIKDKRNKKITYCYKNIYDIFVNKNN